MEDITAETNSGKTDDGPSLEYEYATSTTLHGIGRVAESTGAQGKILWVIVMLLAGGVCVYVTVDRIQAYIKFEATTNVNIKFHDSLDFPAVTICNYNRFMNSKISESDRKYVRHLLQLSDDLWEHFAFRQDYDTTILDTILDQLFEDDFNYTRFALATGYSLKESMFRCVWKGSTSCHVSNFSSYYSPTYGQCYTFNALGQQQMQQGIGNGLQLIVNIFQLEYTEIYSGGNTDAGLKFAIHSPDELPLLDTMGLSASPGFHTYASMRLIRYFNLPKPWGVCGTPVNENGKNYNRNTCLKNCRRDQIISQCACQPLGYDRINEGTVKLCNLSKFHCVKSALETHRASLSAADCKCPIACEYQTYETTLSTAKFPSSSVLQEAHKFYENTLDEIAGFDNEYAEKNFVYLDVYFNELSDISYQQVEVLPFTALLGDLGGQLGLFLGASVITGVELLEYIMWRLKNLILKAKTRNKVQSLET